MEQVLGTGYWVCFGALRRKYMIADYMDYADYSDFFHLR